MPPHPPAPGAAELAAKLEKLGLGLGEREASHQPGLRDARSCLESLRAIVAAALARFHEAAAGAGAPQLRIALSDVRPDDKHLRAVQFDLTRGRYRAIVTARSRGEVTLVGPFHAGKTEGPCLTFPLDAGDDLRAALTSFLERFLESGGDAVSLDRQGAADQQAIVTSAAELVAWFEQGEKPSPDWRVGTEHEKIGLYLRDYTSVPFDGPRGIAAVLESVAERDGWRRIREDAHLIALEKNGASITLEPGGQLELSGAPLRTIHETCSEFQGHLSLMKRISDPLGIVWLGLGINPIHGVGQIPQMPKQRYRIMRSYLPTRGTLALDMMYATATVQANFDYGSEADMVAKLRMALGVTPIVSAIFANSGLSEGKANGYVSRRLHIWQHTDPDRSGLLPIAFEDGFGYRDYVEWALDVPMFFVVRDGRYAAADGMTFRRFMTEGREGERATLDDWARHLTTLFPEVRLKRVIEVRGADAVPPGLTCSLPAIWKGLLYDAGARQAAWELVAASSHEEREAARGDVARRGLAARFAGRSVLELAKELAAISRDGLRRIAHAGRRDPDETSYLDPVFAQLELGQSPGQVVLDRWEGEWGRSLDRLIEYARY